MVDKEIEIREKLASLRAATPARIFLPRSGLALTTNSNLEFQLAHAEARDAVNESMDVDALVDGLRSRNVKFVSLHSAAQDRRAYLLRPDLGRRLDDASRARLEPIAGDYDIAFVVADGLSARAIAAHALRMLDEALQAFNREFWKVAPIVIVEQARVAIGDEIGEILRAKLVAILVGERPGLSSPDSLGIYITFAPRIGRTDAERNCLSNIRSQGTSYADATAKLLYLCREARRRRLTGVSLKEEASSIGCDMTSRIGKV
jgi:ethanolamine ammonia-lyase small subunit